MGRVGRPVTLVLVRCVIVFLLFFFLSVFFSQLWTPLWCPRTRIGVRLSRRHTLWRPTVAGSDTLENTHRERRGQSARNTAAWSVCRPHANSSSTHTPPRYTQTRRWPHRHHRSSKPETIIIKRGKEKGEERDKKTYRIARKTNRHYMAPIPCEYQS